MKFDVLIVGAGHGGAQVVTGPHGVVRADC